MKNTKFLISCFVIFILFESCKKGDSNNLLIRPKTPLERLNLYYDTSVENNSPIGVFGCLINDELWKADWCCNNPSSSFHYPSRQLNMSSKDNSQLDDSSIRFRSIGFAISLDSSGIVETIHSISYFDSEICENNWSYELDSLSEYNISVDEYSTESRKIIGTFNFTLVHNDCANISDTIKVTHGRFLAKF